MSSWNSSALRPLLHRIVRYGFFLSVLCFIFSSSQLAPTLLGEFIGERGAKYLPFVIVVLASGTLFLGLLEYLLLPVRSVPQSGHGYFQPATSKQVLALGLLAAAVFIQVLSQLKAPLHWEDHFHLSNILTEPLRRFNPLIKTEHHTLASLATFLSVQTLGITSIGVKLPALIYTFLFLTVVVAFCRKQTSWAVALSVLTALGVNQMAVWYMHSMRGYIPAMLLCMTLFFLFREATRGIPQNPKRFVSAFVAVCYLTTLTHLFSTIFSLIGVLAFLIWMVMSLEQLSAEHRKFGVRFLLTFLVAVTPVYGFVLFFQALWLESLGDFFKGGFPAVGPSLLHALGISFAWGGRLILVFLGLSLLLRFSREKWTRDFTTWFALITVTLFWIVLSVLQIRLIETRFLLPFVAPFLVWCFETVERIPSSVHRRVLWSVGLGALVVTPLASRDALYEHLTLSTKDYVRFMQQVAEVTKPITAHCYSFSGEPNLVYFSETLYFGEVQGAKHWPNCRPEYHVWFSSPDDLKPIDKRSDDLKRMQTQILYSLNDRMTLSRYVTPKTELP